ncbi:lytic murein transglycosylase [Pseudodonghicola flavimaris]|uniref:Lytic murein transglycosylase n=1 Tax=Pseudodonghicola flavimaris TaxID=3050036 RepID=A0ABT7EZD8_9RHOB|nr:lytic murein transglycosylase [Pseudodonghicola flavimaris]MDK3017722.1 lytic murein transglycosylase [Pseudodonghicola flavimaris]
MRIWYGAAAIALLGGGSVAAQAVDHSPRPEARPAAIPGFLLEAASFVMADEEMLTPSALSPRTSLRPTRRPDQLSPQIAGAEDSPHMPSPQEIAGFHRWVAQFKPRAAAQGIHGDTFDRAFRGLTLDADVIRRDRNQSEFSKPIWAYLDSAASDVRIANGKAALEKHRATLDRIERKYGVDKEVVVAIWGLESAYGSFRGNNNVIRSLATLAYEGRRAAFFEDQLVDALKIVQAGDIAPDKMTGSWAGAMGHTQFMPSSFLEHAVDFTGDGRRDIWSDDPSDALASTAAYLARFGWTRGQPWGVEVRLPKGFDYALAQRSITMSPADWARLGVTGLNGVPVPEYGKAAILLPAGGHGAAFMIFDNFKVIERYNAADAYVIGVGHLSDRIRGAGPIHSAWPRNDRLLSFDERKELQERLTRAGYDTQHVDGRIGPLTISAVRAYQVANGLQADGYPSLDLLKRLR